MIWPDITSIKESVIKESNILDSDIRDNYSFVTKRKNRLTYEAGGFGLAFKMKENRGENFYCFRLWFIPIGQGLKERFGLISKSLMKYKLPYFLKFRYIEKALKVSTSEGQIDIPGIGMAWGYGEKLDQYIASVAGKTSANVVYARLASKFMAMCKEFKRLGIAHGDLSNANVLITPTENIVLIDYDSVYVPAMGNNYYQTTAGTPAFQHPQRLANARLKASSSDDNFSQHIIYLSLLALSKKPELAKMVGDKELLFLPFTNEEEFVASSGYKAISEIEDVEVQARLKELRMSVNGPLADVPSIVDFKMPGPAKPTIKYVEHCYICGYKFPNQTDQYCTQCGTQRLVYG